MAPDRLPLVYALHSGNLYGTERMALATVLGLRDHFAPVLMAPAGPALEEAERCGVQVRAFAGPADFARQLRPLVAAAPRFAFVATGVVHSLACSLWSTIYRRRVAHLHIVHGGTDERLSYGRKRHLNRLAVTFVGVSEYVRTRLVAHGVPAERIRTIENFLPADQVAAAPRRGPFVGRGLERIAVVSRVDPIKRLDLLFEALEAQPDLRTLEFTVLGTGSELSRLRARAEADFPNVTFAGFCADVPDALTRADLLLHLCPVEPFGLAILEAMAADLPVLVPDSGGAGSLIEDGVTGFHFSADDASALAARLTQLRGSAPDLLNRVVGGARASLGTRFSERQGLDQYRLALTGGVR